MISIFTATSGREFYLLKLLESIRIFSDASNVDPYFQHIILFQENKPSKEFEQYLETYPYSKNIQLEFNPIMQIDGDVMNVYKNKATHKLFFKMDDDCILSSTNFFKHVLELHRLKPNAMMSGFPVGLINNLGGVPKISHEVIYGENTDTFYTLRFTKHIGGFAKIIPTEFIQKVNFRSARCEDTDTSEWCLRNGIEMFYLENALIVEHAESTLGQAARYKEYFDKRGGA